MTELITEWWARRGLWMIGDLMMLLVGAVMLILSLMNLLESA